jgi:hypothetical protein
VCCVVFFDVMHIAVSFISTTGLFELQAEFLLRLTQKIVPVNHLIKGCDNDCHSSLNYLYGLCRRNGQVLLVQFRIMFFQPGSGSSFSVPP